jgi:hypothetical protein
MDAQKIKNAIVEISNSMTRSDAEKELVREIIKKINEEEGIDRRLLRKMARVYHKQNFQEESSLNSEFEELFSNIMG